MNVFKGRTKIDFDAAHRLLEYNGKCSSPHGHTYQAEVTIETPDLDNLGLSIDFGDVKKPLKTWVDKYWDHAFLLNSEDEVLISALAAIQESKIYKFDGRNPSAEVMAETLYSVMFEELGSAVASVRIWEGASSYAEYSPNHSVKVE